MDISDVAKQLVTMEKNVNLMSTNVKETLQFVSMGVNFTIYFFDEFLLSSKTKQWFNHRKL